MPDEQRIRVASYNIHECRGPGWPRRERPDRIIDVIGGLDADIVGLQEVATGPGMLDGHLYEIADALNYSAVPGSNLRDDRGDYGNALLSRWPIGRVVNHRLGRHGGFEPRGALEAEIRVGDRCVRMVVTHLGLRSRVRDRQAARLLERLSVESLCGPIVLAGDLNEWRRQGRAARRLVGHFGSQEAPRTYPSPLPVFALDRLLCEPPARLDKVRAYRANGASKASDHLPLVAELTVPARERQAPDAS